MAAEPTLCVSVTSEHTKEVFEQCFKNIMGSNYPFLTISDKISSKTGDIFYRFL